MRMEPSFKTPSMGQEADLAKHEGCWCLALELLSPELWRQRLLLL